MQLHPANANTYIARYSTRRIPVSSSMTIRGSSAAATGVIALTSCIRKSHSMYRLSYFQPCFRKNAKPFSIIVSSLKFISLKMGIKIPQQAEGLQKGDTGTGSDYPSGHRCFSFLRFRR